MSVKSTLIGVVAGAACVLGYMHFVHPPAVAPTVVRPLAVALPSAKAIPPPSDPKSTPEEREQWLDEQLAQNPIRSGTSDAAAEDAARDARYAAEDAAREAREAIAANEKQAQRRHDELMRRMQCDQWRKEEEATRRRGGVVVYRLC